MNFTTTCICILTYSIFVVSSANAEDCYSEKEKIRAFNSQHVVGVGASTLNAMSKHIKAAADISGVKYENMTVVGGSDQYILANAGVSSLSILPSIIPSSGSSVVNIDVLTHFPTLKMATGYIAGVHGTLSYSGKAFVFTRTMPGDAVVVSQGATFSSDFNAREKDYGLIINLGKNDIKSGISSDNAENLTKEAIKKFRVNYPNLIVIGIFNNYGGNYGKKIKSQVDNLNRALSSEYGDQFIDIAAYMRGDQVWIDTKITPTNEDINQQKDNNLPPSLARSIDGVIDGAHTNDAFNRAFVDRFLSCRFSS